MERKGFHIPAPADFWSALFGVIELDLVLRRKMLNKIWAQAARPFFTYHFRKVSYAHREGVLERKNKYKVEGKMF